MLRVLDTSIWQRLQTHAARCAHELDLHHVLKNPGRFEEMSLRAPHMLVDCSKCLWDKAVLTDLFQVARDAGVEQRRDALFAGDAVNVSEQRSALHVRLRALFTKRKGTEEQVPVDECHAGLRAMLALAQQFRTEGRYKDVVHIGIGGSSLGPELVLQALHPWHKGGPRVHLVSNMDGHDLQQALEGLNPATTLFVVASKSWTTAETQRNFASAKAWLCRDHSLYWPSHFVAVTARGDAARATGFIHTLDIPEGIGGRFSVWSAVGLPVALAVGVEVFERLLAGAVEMDAHFASTPLERNVPVWLGLQDVWNYTFMHMPARCVVPYHHGLRRLPAYLQQLEMESNGKRVKADGVALPYQSSGIVWGEPGSNGQHAFFQWLHQGTQIVPVDFIVARKAAHDLPEHQQALLANALAQAQALMCGAKAGEGQLAGHQDFPGNRPSTFMLLEELTPESLGALLALHEHRVLVAGTVWKINSFDQWGVELGKVLAKDLCVRMDSWDVAGLDASTAGLLMFCSDQITA